MNYHDFLASKRIEAQPAGFHADRDALNPALFEWQRDIVVWALARGRAALFEDCGLGKTPQQLVWAHEVCRHTGGNVLILAPLAVSQQTVREGQKFGIHVTACRSQADVRAGINITNYEMLSHFDVSQFAGVVLDESSILKDFGAKTCQGIIDLFAGTPYRLACTATPAPNDVTELANHAHFLGIMPRPQMLSMWFVHDSGKTQDWRLKGHAENAFWKWMCSWAVMIHRPSDLGYDDGGFALPALSTETHVIKTHTPIEQRETLFEMEALTLNEQRRARRETLPARVAAAADLVNADDQPWVVWCDLNDESTALRQGIPGAVEVRGSNTNEEKEQAMLDFAAGHIRVLVTKPGIAGHGLNWQHCARMVFCGLSHSYERRYQAIRRCWRFGQTRPVEVHDVLAHTETAILRNLERKEQDAQRLAIGMVEHMRGFSTKEIRGAERKQTIYTARRPLIVPSWLVSEAA